MESLTRLATCRQGKLRAHVRSSSLRRQGAEVHQSQRSGRRPGRSWSLPQTAGLCRAVGCADGQMMGLCQPRTTHTPRSARPARRRAAASHEMTSTPRSVWPARRWAAVSHGLCKRPEAGPPRDSVLHRTARRMAAVGRCPRVAVTRVAAVGESLRTRRRGRPRWWPPRPRTRTSCRGGEGVELVAGEEVL